MSSQPGAVLLSRTGLPGRAILPPLLSVTGLSRRYGARAAVDGVSFDLGPGVTGLLGPNGAGKSSLLTCLAGIAAWDAGTITLDGHPLRPHSAKARRQLGYTPERVAFPNELRVVDYLQFAARAKRIGRAGRSEEVEKALVRAELLDVRGRILGNLSKGYRQRVGLAQALLGNPAVAILDEPTSGLDPLNMMQIRTMLRDYATDKSVLISTHQLADARLLCDRVIVMSSGRIVYDGTPTGMAERRQEVVRTRIALRGYPKALALPPGVTCFDQRPTEMGVTFSAEVATVEALGELVRTLAQNWTVVSVEPTSDALETAFQDAVLRSPEERSQVAADTERPGRITPSDAPPPSGWEVASVANDSQA